jgi:hypothetical protein
MFMAFLIPWELAPGHRPCKTLRKEDALLEKRPVEEAN